MTNTVRVAMWSGPRNISTAMMRAWENRADCQVIDEPFYAHYLVETGIDHPGRDAVIASQDTDWRQVAKQLSSGPVAQAIFYQKHMAHHLLPGMEGDWMDALRHAILIRDPVEMVASYADRRETVTAADLGFDRLLDIRRLVSARGGRDVPVVDSRDVLERPEPMMRMLCSALGVEFDAAMLAWPAGGRPSDGVWAPHWYRAVEKSTGFLPYEPRRIRLDATCQAVADACSEPYRRLYEDRLTV